jgi:hypothetical protein
MKRHSDIVCKAKMTTKSYDRSFSSKRINSFRGYIAFYRIQFQQSVKAEYTVTVHMVIIRNLGVKYVFRHMLQFKTIMTTETRYRVCDVTRLLGKILHYTRQEDTKLLERSRFLLLC